MTRSCHRYPDLVGPRYWLPPEPFEFGWTTPVGCNNLKCERCGEPVRTEVRPDGERRRYSCACRHHDEAGVHRIGGESDDLYPLELTEWICAGHPELQLPATLDGVRLDRTTDWNRLAVDAVLAPPFAPPRVELRATWLTRLYRLLGAERPLLSSAVATLLDTKDARLVQGAYFFFYNEPDAEGIELLAPSIVAHRDWLAAVPDPAWPQAPLLSQATLLLHRRLRVVDDSGAPVDQQALRLAEELALAGIGPAHAPCVFADHDPEWLRVHAARLVRANPSWIGVLVQVAKNDLPEWRNSIIGDIARVAPEQVQEEIERQFHEPERGTLLSLVIR